MLIILAIFCFIEAMFDFCLAISQISFMSLFFIIYYIIGIILWVAMGIAFIKINSSMRKTKEQEEQIKKMNVQLDYMKKKFDISDEDINKYALRKSNEQEEQIKKINVELDNIKKKFNVSDEDIKYALSNHKDVNGMTQEEMDKLPYFDAKSNSDDKN
jgi:uncharacterized membrane protein YciS (DUF1049 family)